MRSRVLTTSAAALLLVGGAAVPAWADSSEGTSRPLPQGVLAKSNALRHTVTVVPVYSTSPPDKAVAQSMLDAARQFWETQVPGMRWSTRVTSPLRVANPCSAGAQARALKATQRASRVDYRSKGQHLVVYTPECGDITASGSALRAAGYGWIRVFGRDSDGAVLAHEFGHNLGLVHSNTLECTERGRAVSLSGRCSSVEYGNRDDLMGASSTPTDQLRLGPMWQSYLTGRTKIHRPGTSVQVTLSTSGATGTQAVRLKTRYGYLYLGALPGPDQGQLQAVLMTKSGAGRLMLPEASFPDASLTGSPPDALQLGSHWDVPGTSTRVTVVDARKDSVTLQLGPPGGAAPGAPVATVTQGADGQVALTWTSIFGAKAYLVSTSSGVVARLATDATTWSVPIGFFGGPALTVTAVRADGAGATSGPVEPPELAG